MKHINLSIEKLGEATHDSPLNHLVCFDDQCLRLVAEDESVVFDPNISSINSHLEKNETIPSVEVAGPRQKIFFNPKEATAAIVSCGGLCPGINDVIRSIVMELHYRYGVENILGIRYGYQGLVSKFGHEPMRLTPEAVKGIHTKGGTILGSSRGQQDSGEIVDYLVSKNINILFVIGGDGTLRGALDIAHEVEKRGLKISVIGVPKTIDNDIVHIERSFGFATAFGEATKSIESAHSEAHGAPNGIGLVKVMGRHSGFIACFSALAMSDVNFVLIPEVPFKLDGPNGFLVSLKKRIKERGHAVIVVAEGAGQDLMDEAPGGVDASGNEKLKDIGLFLKARINGFFSEEGTEVNVKYIDPSYIIRSVPASALDSVYCLRLAQAAVHAAMSGRTKMVVAYRRGQVIHLPMKAVAGRKQVDPFGEWWFAVLSATGQQVEFK